jgi:hypothetical protein
VLLGFEGQAREDLPWGLQADLGSGLVTAVNLALEGLQSTEDIGARCIAMVLNHTFPVLGRASQERINYNVRQLIVVHGLTRN